jgi:hypothetical protein
MAFLLLVSLTAKRIYSTDTPATGEAVNSSAQLALDCFA